MNHNSEQYVTMSIASLGESTLPRQLEKPFFEKKINDISDIEGARSGPKYQHFFNKPQFLQSDVHGSTSKPLSWSRNVRDNSLYIDDIDGTRHSIKDRMMRTNRHVDPLAPSYPLPSYVPAEDPPTKFIKDPLDHSDIDGSYPKQKKSLAPRDTMRIDDIEGSRPKRGPRQVDPGSLAFSGPAISVPTHRFKDRTDRITDPNNPVYHINGMDYYDDKYTKPKSLKGFIADNHLLQTKDITGATPGFKDSLFPRREIRNINYIQDIDGAHADSIKHSIVTKRQSNPLAPVYQSLDQGELLQPLIPPLIPPSMVKVPTVSVPRGNQVDSAERSSSSGLKSAPGVIRNSHFDDAEFEAVSFANLGGSFTGKPPSGRQFHLDFSGGTQSGGFEGTGGSSRKSPQGSGRGYGVPSNGKSSGEVRSSRIGAAAANSFNNSSGSGYFDATGGGGGGSGRATFQTSPLPSTRSGSGGMNSGRMTPSERRAYLERTAEINAVRDLRQ